jgi:hypothetical protein
LFFASYNDVFGNTLMKDDVFLRTTINFEYGRVECLKERCEAKSVSVASVVKKAVKLYLDSMKKDQFTWNTVSYQKKALKWKKFHITLKAFEYDTYLDARKVSRFCFSLLVAKAVDEFADTILNSRGEDSYPLHGYTKNCIVKDNCTFYTFTWGVPLKQVEITIPPTVNL